MAKRIMIAILLAFVAVSASACSVSFNGSGADNTPDLGGILLSVDRGSSWQRQSSIPSVTGTVGNINDINVRSLAIDPSDNGAVYLQSYGSGLFYTYNVFAGWNAVAGLPKATISALAVDPKNKCHVYAAIGNRLYQTVDCSRSWQSIYIDDNQELVITALAIDFYNSSNVYMGTSGGDILKSINSGTAWRAIKRFEGDSIAAITLSPSDSRYIFVATRTAKLYSFYSNTNTNAANSADIEANFAVDQFMDLNPVLKDLNIGSDFRSLVIVPADNRIFLATATSIVRSGDNGISWEKLNLLTPDKNSSIRAMAASPKSSQELYYVTDTNFFRSADGGATWISKKLQTSRAGSAILIDYKNPNIIYLGFNSAN